MLQETQFGKVTARRPNRHEVEWIFRITESEMTHFDHFLQCCQFAGLWSVVAFDNLGDGFQSRIDKVKMKRALAYGVTYLATHDGEVSLARLFLILRRIFHLWYKLKIINI